MFLSCINKGFTMQLCGTRSGMFQGKLTNFGITVCWPLNGPTEFKNARKICPFDSNCSQKLYRCSLARARNIFAIARVLVGFSSDCCSGCWDILTSGFSLFITVQPVTVLEALYVLSGKRTKLHDKKYVSWYSLYHISSIAGFVLV